MIVHESGGSHTTSSLKAIARPSPSVAFRAVHLIGRFLRGLGGEFRSRERHLRSEHAARLKSKDRACCQLTDHRIIVAEQLFQIGKR